MNIRLIISAIIIGVVLAILLSGCAYYSHDKEAYLDPMNLRMCEFESTRVITLFKQFDVVIDPNRIDYQSDSKKVNIITPWGALGSEK